MNKGFGKIVDEQLVLAPVPLEIGGKKVWTNRADLHAEKGYLPVKRTLRPNTQGKNVVYRSAWEEADGRIIQNWIEVNQT